MANFHQITVEVIKLFPRFETLKLSCHNSITNSVNFFLFLFLLMNISFSMKNCNCHGEARSTTPTANTRSVNSLDKGQVKLIDAASQTLSTGDIVITKIIFEDEHEKAKEKVLTSSPKRNNS